MVATDSPQKRGRGDGAALFESQAEQVAQLPWHEDTVHAFEACANEEGSASPLDGVLSQGREVGCLF